jgi:hypothetical protein
MKFKFELFLLWLCSLAALIMAIPIMFFVMILCFGALIYSFIKDDES